MTPLDRNISPRGAPGAAGPGRTSRRGTAASTQRKRARTGGARDRKNGGSVLRAPAAVQYAWIHQQHTTLKGSRMGRLLAVSRRGDDEGLGGPPRAHTDADQPVPGRRPALFGAGAWDLRHTPHQASLGSGGPAGQSTPDRTLTGPGWPALYAAASRPRAARRGPSPASRPEPAELRGDGARTRYGVRRRYHRPAAGRGWALSRWGAGAVLASGGRVVNGPSYAGRVGESGVDDGPRPAAAGGGVDQAYRSWPPVGRRQLSAAPDPAGDPAPSESEGEGWGPCWSGGLLAHLKDRVGLPGGIGHARRGPHSSV